MTISRRNLLGAAASAPLAGCVAGTIRGAIEPRTFVFVPGTWHGGWAWTPLADLLRSQGHHCFTVTCTGLGERRHLLTPDVGLETHIDDVAGVLEYEELNDVILVGHSFGGITISGVADRLRTRIRHLVFYDAFIPTRDRPAWVMPNDDGEWPQWWRDRQARFIDGYKMDFFAEYPIEMLVDPVRYPNVAASTKRRLTHHPAKQWTDKVSFANGGWEELPRTYIHCTGQKYRQTSAAMYGPAKAPGWDWLDSPTVRLGMLTDTQLTAELFNTIARS